MPKSILDRSFRYVPSHKTNVRATIARELRRLAEEKRLQQDEAERIRIEAEQKVRKIGGKK